MLRADWLSLQTLKLADERSSWKVKRRENRTSSKHYNFLCRQVKKRAKADKERFIVEIRDTIEGSRKTQQKSRRV